MPSSSQVRGRSRRAAKPPSLRLAGAALVALAVVGAIAGGILLLWDEGPAARTASYVEIAAAEPEVLQVYRLKASPGIVIFDYASYMDQAQALNRVAALVEKRHLPRDRIVTPAELDRYIEADGGRYATFYYGHNYDPGELARFFSLAMQTSVELNPAELELRERLVATRTIRPAEDGYTPGMGADYVISLVAADAPEVDADMGERARAVALEHELGHAWYAVDPDYHSYVRRFWSERMTPEDREAFRKFLAVRDYDINNEGLVIDEAQAYLAFTPDDRVVSDSALGLPPGRLSALRRMFQPPSRPPWGSGV